MREDFLSFIWRFQYFDTKHLTTTDGDSLQIIETGRLNSNAGADFELAKIRIGEVEWIGSIEIHLKSSDWKQHRHNQNTAYNNVILHVVWEDNQSTQRKDDSQIPTLELKQRINPKMLYRYQSLLDELGVIPCHKHLAQVKAIQILTMLDKALVQRLEHKAETVIALWENNQRDWEETTYQLLAQNFGFKTNAATFLRLAQSLPLRILQKHKGNLLQIEALLFGQAGFLDLVEEENLTEEYPRQLLKEYQFLAQKYQIQENRLAPHEWKMLRMRPPNFPTIRIAQFACLINQHESLFSTLLNTDTDLLKTSLKILQSDYWQRYYQWEKPASRRIGGLGVLSIENVFINTLAPLLTAYSKVKDQSEHLERALLHLEQLPAEKNKIITMWAELGLKVKTAFDSQALLELYKSYCLPKKCLSCNIGTHLVREGKDG